MPAWTPDAEGFAPYDEDGELRDDIPPDLAGFIQRFDIQKQFTIEIKKWNNEGYQGRPSTVGRMEAVVPTYESIVALNGPGHYGFDTTWTPKGGKPRNEVFKVSLVGAHWTQLHKDAKVEKHKADLDEAKREAELERARGGVAPLVGSFSDPNKAGREYMQGILGDIKGLTEAFGLNVAGAKGGNGGGDSQMGMMFLGMMQMMMKQSENNTNLLIAVLGNNNKKDDTKEMFGLIREAFSLRDGLMPRDKSWIEEVVGAVADNVGPILGLFARGNPEDDPMHQKLDAGLTETRDRAQQDPNFLKSLVKHMDTKVGASMTDKILNGFLHVKRPGAAQGAPAGSGPASPSQGGEAGAAGSQEAD
jgi:hypothetical protein